MEEDRQLENNSLSSEELKVMEEDHQLENNSLSSEELKECSLTLQEGIYKSFNQQAYETGQSSQVYPIPTQYCPICTEAKHPHETFVVQGCFHVFCLDCIRGHITAKIKENITKVRCLQWDCERELEIESCGIILPPKLLDRWGDLLCESAILEQTKFYCPFRDCSALLLADDRIPVTESQCPHCSRLFCAHCKVPWHSGIGCEEFQKLKVDDREREDIMVVKLAKEKKWQKCPRCGFIVERIEGCLSMICRCNCRFCYGCGAQTNGYRCSKCSMLPNEHAAAIFLTIILTLLLFLLYLVVFYI